MSPWIDRQFPQGDEIFLDHIGYFVADLDEAGSRLERLGFAVSPVNVHTHADETGKRHISGTSNRLAMLRRGFIEILAATHDTKLADRLKQSLARYEGIHLIAVSHDDIAGLRRRSIAAGFGMQEIVDLRRTGHTPQGLRDVAWSVLRPEPGVIAEGRVQFVKCHTPDTVWAPGMAPPANGAEGLGDLLLCVADRPEASGRLGRYLDRAPTDRGSVSAIALDRGRILVADRAGAAKILPGFSPPDLPYMAGQAIRSADLSATRAALAKGGIKPLFANDTLICVGPGDALGGYLLFHSTGIDDPWAALAARS